MEKVAKYFLQPHSMVFLTSGGLVVSGSRTFKPLREIRSISPIVGISKLPLPNYWTLMANGLEIWVAASTIATGVVTVGGAILGFLINSTRREISQSNKLLHQRIDNLQEEQREQGLRLERLQKEFNEHKVYIEGSFVKKDQLDELKLSLAELKALIISLPTKEGCNDRKKG